MSTGVPPMSQETASAGLSEPQRIINVFIAPSKTFEDIRRNASWWVPWLIGAIFITSIAFFYNKKVDLEPLVREQLSSRPTWDSLTKDQQDQQVALGLKIAKITPYFFPVIGIIISLIVSAVLMAVFNFVHEASVSYSRSLAIFFYGGLPTIIAAILALIAVAAAGDIEGRNPRNLVATNPAYFMDYHTASKFAYGMAQSFDVITIWIIVLMGIGFKINSAKTKLTTGTAIGTIFAIYLVYRLVVSSLGWV